MKRLLIADDQRDVLTALELLFKAEGISATTTTSPEAIVTWVERECFDAVLMDLNYARDTTSGEEGLDVLTRLASIPGSPPVIVMTAWGSIELAVEAMKRGARDFVTKPWDNRELLATIGRNTLKEPARYARNELEVASQVQHKLWPGGPVTLSNLSLSGHCRPVGAVGGDTFDFVPLGAGRLAFSIADVSEKGLPAALLMASLQAILRSGVSHGATDVIIGRWSADYSDADTFVYILHSKGGGYGRFTVSPELDRLAERGRAEAAPAVRHSLYREVEEILVRDALLIPMFRAGLPIRPPGSRGARGAAYPGELIAFRLPP